MKYIMLACTKADMVKKVPIIFPDFLTHVEVSNSMCASPEIKQFDSVIVSSAGFVSSLDLDVTCTGGSETLKLSANPEDAEIIKMYDYMHGLA